ncbi:MAG: nucleotidyl transferase AbiEii/AbiGii toxin family protein [Paludibacteraceae bacterium]|nr:nucleotidyl transferase AbiEii/AbiGii toxin family protein [Paludibacteraceae bacterium]
MINKKCFTKQWIDQKSQELNYSDKNLIEKVIRAFSLLDMLVSSGCPFCFKGGSSLMLIFNKTTHRLSIDIDIMCPPGTDIEQYLLEYAKNGFISYQLIERKQAGKDVPKEHSKFYYKVAFNEYANKESFILLDVIYEVCYYQQVERVVIEHELIESEGTPLFVNIPSVGDILGDKLTAFAPETTGIPYYKGGYLTTLEIIKQLYDIGRLFDRVEDLQVTKLSFEKIAPIELSYRGLCTSDMSQIFNDIRKTSLNITTRGMIDKEKFELLQQGIKSIKSFMYKSQYRIEQAIVDSSKAAYLATCIELKEERLSHYGDMNQIVDLSIGRLFPSKLNKLKLSNSEAFYYWYKTEELLINKNKK